jgi:hypothetical protein
VGDDVDDLHIEIELVRISLIRDINESIARASFMGLSISLNETSHAKLMKVHEI